MDTMKYSPEQAMAALKNPDSGIGKHIANL